MGLLFFAVFDFCIVFLFLTISVSSSAFKDEENIYEVLRSHGLPPGLLPKGITEFSLDEKGRFEVHLNEACNAKFENEVHYGLIVSGNLSYGRIGALSGICAQELFLWFPVKGIQVDIPSSGLIYFDVGVIHKQFSLSLFETPPDCQALSDSVCETQSRKLRYELDQEDLQRSIL